MMDPISENSQEHLGVQYFQGKVPSDPLSTIH